MRISVQWKPELRMGSYTLCHHVSIENNLMCHWELPSVCLSLYAVLKPHWQIFTSLCPSSLVPLGFDLLLALAGVFILASLCNLLSFPHVGAWQCTRDLYLLPILSSGSLVGQVVHMYDVQSTRSFYHRGQHLPTLSLDSYQCFTPSTHPFVHWLIIVWVSRTLVRSKRKK